MKNPLSHLPLATCHLLLSTYPLPLATCYLLLATFFLTSQTPKAQEWSEPITIFEGGRNYHQDFAIDSHGNLHVVWELVIIPYQFAKIYYSKSTDQGATWTAPYSIAQNNSGWLSSPKIAIDANNTIYVTYDFDTQEVYHTKVHLQIFDGNSWGQPLLVSQNAGSSYYSHIAIDNNHVLHILWTYLGTLSFHHRTFYEGNFGPISQPYNDGNGHGLMKCVFDKENVLHCLGGTAPPSESYSKLVYFTYDNNTWSNFIKLDDTTSVHSALALNTNNEPRAVWWTFIETYLDSTRYRSYGNNQWSAPQIIAGKSQQHALFVEQSGTEYIVQSEKTATGYDHAYYTLNDNGWNRNVIAQTIHYPAANKMIEFDTTLYLMYSIPVANDIYNSAIKFRKLRISSQSSMRHPNFKQDFAIYPNPLKDKLVAKINEDEFGIAVVSICDMYGKLVYTTVKEIANGLIQCNLPQIPIGVYMLTLSTKNNENSKTIVITK